MNNFHAHSSRKILILTVSFGNGHLAAAYNLKEALLHPSLQAPHVKVEVVDLFRLCYGKTHDIIRNLFLRMVRHAPFCWKTIYHCLSGTTLNKNPLLRFKRVEKALHDMIRSSEPDVILTTHPSYNHILQRIFQHHHSRPFTLITVVTDSISIHPLWYSAPSDFFMVPNAASAQVLMNGGVEKEKIRDFGFPVSLRFHDLAKKGTTQKFQSPSRHILLIIHHGKQKHHHLINQLLNIPGACITITCSCNRRLALKLERQFRFMGERVRVLGWTDRIPELLHQSHLVITKAGGAMIQEAIAAECPILINQIIPGQEEGNAELVESYELGKITLNDKALIQTARDALAPGSMLSETWRHQLKKVSRPGSALEIAGFVLSISQPPENHLPPNKKSDLFPDSHPSYTRSNFLPSKNALLCDFHTHTCCSDGKLTISELVDFYGTRHFDCLCITDHIAEKSRMIGRIINLSQLTLPWSRIQEYFDVIQMEKNRAWREYQMILMIGLEFNKDGWFKESSSHLLGIDLKEPINPDLEIKDLIYSIHEQGGLAIASHPHEVRSKWGKNTLYLWENQDEFAPLLDAWEIANRDDLFNPIGLKRLPFIANSDFHKPKHIYSWKTLLNCEKDPDAIKQCIRKNRDIAITLYRDERPHENHLNCFSSPSSLPSISWVQSHIPLPEENSPIPRAHHR